MDQTAFHILDSLYPASIVFLDEKDPFRFLIMVILSAQTTDRRVMEVSPLLFSRYADADALSAAPATAVEDIIRPLGFYHMKAKNIIATSAEIVKRGGIPSTIEELVTLPGVGRKTANCYVGQFLKRGAVIVDTHFLRVANRLGYSSSKDPAVVEEDIRADFEESEWYRLSMVLNAFGRDICHSRSPECDKCPVRSYCTRM